MSNLGANLSVLRDHNTAVVLGLLRDAGEHGASRAELAAATGLTPQAVSKITARLREEGLAADAGRRASTGGKPAAALRLVAGAALAVGVQVDRDAVTAVLVDLAGAVLAVRTAPVAFGAGAEVVLSAVAGEVRAVAEGASFPDPAPSPFPEGLLPEGLRPPATPGPRSAWSPRMPHGLEGEPAGGGARLLGVGIAVPGPLDHRLGVLGKVTGFAQWDGFPLRDALRERLGLPVVLDKDTNAAALGLTRRTARPGGSFAYLHLGTGLGAGLVLGGAVHRGARTGAGEFGHQVLQLDGPPCACGRRGCLEVLCLRAVAAGDRAQAARLLGTGAANLVQLLDVDRVVLGGRTVLADPEVYLRGVRAEVPATVAVAVAPARERTVAEGAAESVLAPLFGPATRPDDAIIAPMSGV
ncbi:ROK family transcriptional regulator [Streptomyces sp. NPDC049555]|uniref:ROK family transcriptional regulator n=1 Tax=unclassified Streptomyces TaxID=2593676 RepID=UPI0034127E8D